MCHSNNAILIISIIIKNPSYNNLSPASKCHFAWEKFLLYVWHVERQRVLDRSQPTTIPELNDGKHITLFVFFNLCSLCINYFTYIIIPTTCLVEVNEILLYDFWVILWLQFNSLNKRCLWSVIYQQAIVKVANCCAFSRQVALG